MFAHPTRLNNLILGTILSICSSRSFSSMVSSKIARDTLTKSKSFSDDLERIVTCASLISLSIFLFRSIAFMQEFGEIESWTISKSMSRYGIKDAKYEPNPYTIMLENQSQPFSSNFSFSYSVKYCQ